MKILTPEELATLQTRALGKKHPVRRAIEALAPGQALQVSRKEFSWRQRTPRVFCTEISKTTTKRFEVKALRDNSGWIVQRLE